MSDNYLYARPYAEAAFKIALKDNNIGQWRKSLGILSSVISDMEIKAILADPKIPDEKTVSFLMSFIPKTKDKKIKKFLNILLNTKRIFFMKEICVIYGSLAADHSNVKVARVEASFKLTDKEINILKEKLEKKYKTKINLEQSFSNKLIAGLKIKVEDEVIDLSIKYQLDQLEEQLML